MLLCGFGKLVATSNNYPCLLKTAFGQLKNCPKMNVFVEKFNPIMGKNEWCMQPENYDYHQEVARSAYADMLHDKERNQKYYAAIKEAVSSMKQQGRSAKVLDIGTGTGLLSLMAAHSGADTVIACECFQPVADCALEVIKDNRCENKIKVVPKRSTELTVGPDGDMQERANILVAEVFDTELIGEGALETFSHALECLLEPNPIVVPSSATVYVQIVESELVLKWKNLYPVYIDRNTSIIPPPEVVACPGSPALHDIQMSQLPEDKFCCLTNPIPVFQFNFTDVTTLDLNGVSLRQVPVIKSGSCEVIFFWWSLSMDMSDNITLSTAPRWAHPNPSKMQWRDHWMQAVYYLPQILNVSKNDVIHLYTYHDDYSFWFNISRPAEIDAKYIERPVCSCSVHSDNSRSRIGMLNDQTRNMKLLSILEKCINETSVCLCVSSGNFLPLMAAKLGAKKVFTIQPKSAHQKMLESYIKNNQENRVKVIGKEHEEVNSEDLENEKINILIAEPVFCNSVLPWDNLYFWYLRTNLDAFLKPYATVIPSEITIKAVAVYFEDLWKIRAPVVKAEGFNLSKFDKLVQDAIAISDAKIEPHPLWEYKSMPLTEPFEVLTFNVVGILGSRTEKASGKQHFTGCGTCNGIALWIDVQSLYTQISTGPTETVKYGHEISWDFNSSQGVFFIQPSVLIQELWHQKLCYEASFNPATGNINIDFKIE